MPTFGQLIVFGLDMCEMIELWYVVVYYQFGYYYSVNEFDVELEMGGHGRRARRRRSVPSIANPGVGKFSEVTLRCLQRGGVQATP